MLRERKRKLGRKKERERERARVQGRGGGTQLLFQDNDPRNDITNVGRMHATFEFKTLDTMLEIHHISATIVLDIGAH